ncbi:MAG: guanylate kinase [Candidatus Cloacimonadota bacterium]|nr:MAG: guanylate kinase [Candidatus Cloacimonadota bacterium]
MVDKGVVIVVSGPSGSGKSTICSYILKENGSSFGLVVSHTSRVPREGEVDGIHYHFLSKEVFLENKKNGLYLEWAEVHGNLYGTPIDQVEDSVAKQKNIILEIDVQGGLQVKAKMPEAVLIFVSPPSYKELENRLRGRQTDSDEVIVKRLENAVGEMQKIKQYDYFIINKDLQVAINDVILIGTTERKRVLRLNLNEIFDSMRFPKFQK